jgi:hypothetical protein
MTALQHARGAAVMSVLLVLVVGAAVAYLGFSLVCPCERTPGGWLFGDTVSEPVDDWTFANDVPLCQIQVYRWGLYPHSINLNCMASDGALFLSCAGCDGKAWSSAALAHPEARLRLGDQVYPVRLARVTDPAVLDEAWNARARKTGRGEGSPRQDGWWSFRVVSR